MSKRSVSILAGALLALIGVSGCYQYAGVTNPVVGDYLPPVSPGHLLSNLILSYQARDLDEYASLFDPAEFRFQFSQLDRDSDPTIPPFFFFNEDRQSTSNMFGDDTIDRILVRFLRQAPVPATEDDDLPGGPAGVWKVAVHAVHLEIHVTDHDGMPLEYLVDGDRADFFFRQYPNEPINGQPSWKIVLWRDLAHGKSPITTEQRTWGAIKSLWQG